jgi:mRNA interferase RelE/StbE
VARFSLFITGSAVKEIEAIAVKRDRQLIVSRIRALAENPRPRGCEKLEGTTRLRVRQGHYRVLYHISDADQTVTIVKVGHRREVYR